MKTNSNKLKDAVLEKIACGETKMHSKGYFFVRSALYVLEVLFVGCLLFFLTSFLFFFLRQTGVWFVPNFGLEGLGIFLTSLPWILVLCLFAILVLLEILLKKHTALYRGPLVYSLITIFVVAVGIGFLLAQTPLHDGLLRHAQAGKLPVVGPVYTELCGKKFARVHPGTVMKVEEGVLCVQNRAGELVAVLVHPKTHLPVRRAFHVGDHVVILGERQEDQIEARGIHPVQGDIRLARVSGEDEVEDSVKIRCTQLLQAIMK